MTYEETLELAYPAYEAYRNFEIWGDAHCDHTDAQTMTNLRNILAPLYAESAGQIKLISNMFTHGGKNEYWVREDLEAMYGKRHGTED